MMTTAISRQAGRDARESEQQQVGQEFADRVRRHTWTIDPPSTFYRYFRIIGSGTDYERAENASDCLHGVGLELYGDIHED